MKKKLAAIDKHVNALDPNWPVTATVTDPPSPTIHVNPDFLPVSLPAVWCWCRDCFFICGLRLSLSLMHSHAHCTHTIDTGSICNALLSMHTHTITQHTHTCTHTHTHTHNAHTRRLVEGRRYYHQHPPHLRAHPQPPQHSPAVPNQHKHPQQKRCSLQNQNSTRNCLLPCSSVIHILSLN